MKSALITGGQGYIGTHLTASLLASGWFVTTLDSGFSRKDGLVDFSPYHKQLRRFDASVANTDAVIRAMEHCQVVFHLASRNDWEPSYRHPMRLTQANVMGTANLLCMARRAGIDRVIYTSDCQVYGNVVGAKETDNCNPITFYGTTKLAAEAICRGFYQTGMEVVILRLSEVWGNKGCPSIIYQFVQGSNLCGASEGRTNDFVHISDVLEALHSALQWESGIYNIGTGEETSIEGLLGLVNPTAKPEYKQLTAGLDEVQRFCCDLEYVKQAGWKPKILLSELDCMSLRMMNP